MIFLQTSIVLASFSLIFSKWDLVFNDEFNGDVLDHNKWFALEMCQGNYLLLI